MMSSVPSALLTSFFETSTLALNKYQLEERNLQSPHSLLDLRKQLLQVQKDCLDHVLASFDQVSLEDAQRVLRNLPRDVSDHEMNEAARLAFCRLVLHQECLWEERESGRHLILTGTIERGALLEFMTLCETSIKMHEVSTHLEEGNPLMGIEGGLASPQFPSKRMERIQRLFMTAIGYNPDFGTEEIKRIFFTPKTPSEFTGDREVEEHFGHLLNKMHLAIACANSSLHKSLSDQDEGGVTRVISVTYSEKEISSDTVNEGQSIGAPRQQETERGHLHQDLKLARDAATLQQSILGQLLTMDESDREKTLKEAKDANDSFIKRALELPVGAERIVFMQSIDSETQGRLLMHKIWAEMLQAHGGKLPTGHYTK